MKDVAWFCAHRKKWKLRGRRWKCKQCKKIGRYPKPKTWISGLRKTRKHLKKLVRYFVFGVPTYRLRFEAPVNIKTIQSLFKTIREAIYQESLKELALLSGELEMDETMFGGKRSGKRGWGAEGKVIVFGIYQRNGKVLTFPISSRAKETLHPIIKKHTRAGSLYYTDDWHAYATLPVKGKHVIISKEKGTPKGRDHLNGIEGFWSYAKHWLHQYRGVPKEYFHLYLKEIEFRFNNRNQNLIPLIMKLLRRRCTS